ncbi:MAG: YeiH family protein [Bacteroidota bacterium]
MTLGIYLSAEFKFNVLKLYYFNRENREHTIKGLLFVALFAAISTVISLIPSVKSTGMSPLIIGVLISMVYGNTLRKNLPQKWLLGIIYSTKFVLRAAIIFYGFRITFQEIESVGMAGLMQSLVMVASTFIIGSFIGIRLMKMDSDLAMLTSSGSAVCGAAAVLATESVLKSDPYKSVIAVSTVVLFGTISMFVYPLFYQVEALSFSTEKYGIYIGGSVHEVAQVVVSGNAVSEAAADTGLIVKMTRVMLLAPLLVILSIILSGYKNRKQKERKKKAVFIPYFIFGFIGVAIFNSFDLLPSEVVDKINVADTFLLTMAMCALGMETNFSKFRETGSKPVVLAFILLLWLIGGGYFFTTLFTGI